MWIEDEGIAQAAGRRPFPSPVIGDRGHVTDAQSACRLLEETGRDTGDR
ncbi:MAG: hypothetical protein ACLR0P_11050 [Oscillospiraceae bacterium]